MQDPPTLVKYKQYSENNFANNNNIHGNNNQSIEIKLIIFNLNHIP